MNKKAIIVVLIVSAVVLLFFLFSVSKQAGKDIVAEQGGDVAGSEVEMTVRDATDPGKEAELLSVIAADAGVESETAEYYEAFLSSQNERLVVVWGFEGFKFPLFIATFDVDRSGTARLKNSNVTGIKGNLNQYGIENVRWANDAETEIRYEEITGGGPDGLQRREKVITF